MVRLHAEQIELEAGPAALAERLRRGYQHRLGGHDPHTYVRWRAISEYLQMTSGEVLDVGCGDGLFTNELAVTRPAMRLTGIDVSPQGISDAERMKRHLGLDNVTFMAADVSAVDTFPDRRFDLVMVLDVLEHLRDPAALIQTVARLLKADGTLLVSVPTPNYPKWFGRQFHEAVGHLRDGFWKEDVEALLDGTSLVVTEHRYYGLLPSSAFCGVYYRWLWENKLGVLAAPILATASRLDRVWPWSRGRGAASLLLRIRPA